MPGVLLRDMMPMMDESHTSFMERCMDQMTEAECQMIWDNSKSLKRRDANQMQRAFSILDVKSIVNEEERIIEGIASTPTVDRMGDIVRPRGAKYKVPFPLLWQHRSDQPVGWVEFAKPTDDGIPFKARFAKIEELGRLRERVDEAWQSVKHKLVRAVSIGFKIVKHVPLDPERPWGGWDITEWEWLELSAVTIPANADCTITQIRSIVHSELAASSRGDNETSTKPAGASASRKTVKVKEKETMPKTVAEQISAFEATRQAKAARMQAIMEASAESGETLDEAQSQEYDGLKSEIVEVDKHLTRLREFETLNKAAAAPINGSSQQAASESRQDPTQTTATRVQVIGDTLPKGMPFVRAVIAGIWAEKTHQAAHDIAKARWPDHPEIEGFLRHKAAVTAGTTTNSTWAAPLVVAQNLPGDFIEYLRPMTIIGRIPGFRRVPFNISVPRQTSGASVNWVGETKIKPLSSLAFDQVTLGFTKIAGIIPLSEELVRFSSPSAEAIVRTDLANSIVQLMDRDFIDPSKAAAAGVSPASVTNGRTPVTATGTAAANFRSDASALMQKFFDNNIGVGSAVWIMTQTQALQIGLMLNSLGAPLYPGITAAGGTLFGLPVITSENIPDVGDSPANGSRIVLLNAGEVMLADDGDVSVDVSREASLQMDSAPDSPPTATTVLVSLWQHNMIAVKAERYINWVKRRAEAAEYINYAKYVS